MIIKIDGVDEIEDRTEVVSRHKNYMGGFEQREFSAFYIMNKKMIIWIRILST